MRRSARSRASRISSGLPFKILRARCRSETGISFSGSTTSRATSLMNLSRVCEPPALRKPRSLPSELMYATAFLIRSSPCASAHSVEPSSPGSSPSHAQ